MATYLATAGSPADMMNYERGILSWGPPLVAKDHHFDLPIEVVGRASYQPNDTAQQQIHESNEHGPTSHEKNAR